MDLLDCTLGALPDLDWQGSQKWQASSSFCELELAESGSDTWLGCDLLLDPLDEEHSSKLLSQELVLSHAPTTITDYDAFYPRSQAASLSLPPLSCTTQQATAAVAAVRAGTSCGVPSTSGLHSVPSLPLANPGTPPSAAKRSAMLLQHQASRAGTPVAAVAAAASQAAEVDYYSDPEAVCLVGMALQLAQGDANAAMAQLLAWASGTDSPSLEAPSRLWK